MLTSFGNTYMNQRQTGPRISIRYWYWYFCWLWIDTETDTDTWNRFESRPILILIPGKCPGTDIDTETLLNKVSFHVKQNMVQWPQPRLILIPRLKYVPDRYWYWYQRPWYRPFRYDTDIPVCLWYTIHSDSAQNSKILSTYSSKKSMAYVYIFLVHWTHLFTLKRFGLSTIFFSFQWVTHHC